MGIDTRNAAAHSTFRNERTALTDWFRERTPHSGAIVNRNTFAVRRCQIQSAIRADTHLVDDLIAGISVGLIRPFGGGYFLQSRKEQFRAVYFYLHSGKRQVEFGAFILCRNNDGVLLHSPLRRLIRISDWLNIRRLYHRPENLSPLRLDRKSQAFW